LIPAAGYSDRKMVVAPEILALSAEKKLRPLIGKN
jgi:hypothetical protein